MEASRITLYYSLTTFLYLIIEISIEFLACVMFESTSIHLKYLLADPSYHGIVLRLITNTIWVIYDHITDNLISIAFIFLNPNFVFLTSFRIQELANCYHVCMEYQWQYFSCLLFRILFSPKNNLFSKLFAIEHKSELLYFLRTCMCCW